MALGLMSSGVIASLEVNLLANGCLIDLEAIVKSCPSINIAHGGYNVSVEPGTICITPTAPSTISYVVSHSLPWLYGNYLTILKFLDRAAFSIIDNIVLSSAI